MQNYYFYLRRNLLVYSIIIQSRDIGRIRCSNKVMHICRNRFLIIIIIYIFYYYYTYTRDSFYFPSLQFITYNIIYIYILQTNYAYSAIISCITYIFMTLVFFLNLNQSAVHNVSNSHRLYCAMLDDAWSLTYDSYSLKYLSLSLSSVPVFENNFHILY